MINTADFYAMLKEKGVDFFTGVPDSLLKDFCAYVKDNTPENKNIVAANEGNALALAAGYHLATGKAALVYMQNSGLGNIVNPLASLTDRLVYSIPALLLIGWRGEPGKKDEPQHVKQGKITLELLETLGIKYDVIGEETTFEVLKEVFLKAYQHMMENKEPYAFVIQKGAFQAYKLKSEVKTSFELSREEAIKLVVSVMEKDAVVVSTTGMASRELFELREALGDSHERDFLTVGSMGHSSQIALGISVARPEKTVYCLDGDGAFLMHMGAGAVVAAHAGDNYRHIIINNGAHDSVGGQPTLGFDIDVPAIAKASGYREVYSASGREEVMNCIQKMQKCKGPALLEIKVNKGARKDLGRPTTTPVENKTKFMEFLGK
ncbi:MAG: phosphonopyruvate decarboxylase [Bacillota bacterium]|nr:phosphonopyruvate decarboxylase [Bacillota bacterium]